MPKLVEISKEQFHATTKKPRAANKKLTKREKIHRRYLRMLKPYVKGGFVEVTVQKGETRQTVKNRLKRAADDLGVKLEFKRTRGKIRFEVKK